MAFNSIDSFFSRFKKITPPDHVVRVTVLEVLKEIVGVNMDISCISVEGGNVRIKNNSFVKSEIFLHKEQVLQKLKEKLGDLAPKNIL
ncbi:MAG: hypothetical protein KAI72_02350 [Candidatus Pacebacteria bacterium]|nr:hypothetical protein [Candidatus Paceibacterota bacterium]